MDILSERARKCRACFHWNCWHPRGEYCTRAAEDPEYGRCWCHTDEYVYRPEWRLENANIGR